MLRNTIKTFWQVTLFHCGTFQQDNARPHVAQDNMDYLRCNITDVLPWLALSPDLSPIEHLWDQLDRMVRKRQQQLQTLNQLRATLMEEWQHIPQVSINRLIASMHRRCVKVLLPDTDSCEKCN